MDYYIMAFATLLSAVLGLVFSIYSVRKDTDEAKTNALYMLARSLALVLISAIPLCRKNSGFLWLVTLAMLIAQLADGIVGIYKKANENGGAVYYGFYSRNLSLELFINRG